MAMETGPKTCAETEIEDETPLSCSLNFTGFVLTLIC